MEICVPFRNLLVKTIEKLSTFNLILSNNDDVKMCLNHTLTLFESNNLRTFVHRNLSFGTDWGTEGWLNVCGSAGCSSVCVSWVLVPLSFTMRCTHSEIREHAPQYTLHVSSEGVNDTVSLTPQIWYSWGTDAFTRSTYSISWGMFYLLLHGSYGASSFSRNKCSFG